MAQSPVSIGEARAAVRGDEWRILNKILDRKAMPTRKVSTLGVNVRDASAKITRGV
jgi:hypothetical protein